MIKSALQWLAELAVAAKSDDIVQVDERLYSTIEMKPITPPRADKLVVTTLAGLVDYLTANKDRLQRDGLTCHVRCPESVELIDAVEDAYRTRQTWIVAAAALPDLRFGRWQPLEEFMIWLQTHFVPSDAMAAVQQFVGAIADEATVTVKDDGVTQETVARSGITKLAAVDVPRGVDLRPFRTFAEVEQPASRFVLRLRKAPCVEAALFEADGGAWRVAAIEAVAEYLRPRLPEGVALIA